MNETVHSCCQASKKSGSDHGSDHRSQSTDWIRLIDTRNFACKAKIKSAWHNGAQTALGGFFCPKTPCSYFHGCVQRGVLCSATMDEGRREVRILHKSVIIIIIIFFSYHLTCYFSFIVCYSAHAREEANNEVRSRTVLDKTTC